MTAFPPPVPPQYPPAGYASPYAQPPVPQTNGWAIVSLVCGLIGCLVITPVIAIGAGFVGLSKATRLGSGRGLAVCGILLGLGWLLVFGGIGLLGVKGYHALQTTKAQTIALVNRVEAGNVTPDAATGTLTAAQLEALAAKAKPMGACQAISVNNVSASKVNAAAQFNFSGTATFEHGTAPISVRLHNDPAGLWVLDDVTLQ